MLFSERIYHSHSYAELTLLPLDLNPSSVLRLMMKYVFRNMHVNEDCFVWSHLKGKFLDFYQLLIYTDFFFPPVYSISIMKCKKLHFCQISHATFATPPRKIIRKTPQNLNLSGRLVEATKQSLKLVNKSVSDFHSNTHHQSSKSTGKVHLCTPAACLNIHKGPHAPTRF